MQKKEKKHSLITIRTDSRDTHIYIVPILKHKWNIDDIFLNHYHHHEEWDLIIKFYWYPAFTYFVNFAGCAMIIQ